MLFGGIQHLTAKFNPTGSKKPGCGFLPFNYRTEMLTSGDVTSKDCLFCSVPSHTVSTRLIPNTPTL